MSNEKEMLEYAANACGITKDDSAYNGGGSNNTGFDIMGNLVTDWHNGESWNPLANSADCAAMCAKLKIETVWFPCHMACEIVTEEDTHIWHVSNYIDHNNNPEAAWRYSATMVAANIGGMK